MNQNEPHGLIGKFGLTLPLALGLAACTPPPRYTKPPTYPSTMPRPVVYQEPLFGPVKPPSPDGNGPIRRTNFDPDPGPNHDPIPRPGPDRVIPVSACDGWWRICDLYKALYK